MQGSFTQIYENKRWGDNGIPRYSGSSGPGSAVGFNGPYIEFLRDFIKTKGIESVADVGCGDFRCGPHIFDAKIGYTGYDVYEKLVDYLSETVPEMTFKCLDVTEHPEGLEPADLCVIKDVMQHWPDAAITSFLDYVVDHRLFKYILMTNDTNGRDGTDIAVGGYHRVSSQHPALKKHGATVAFSYRMRECCLITLSS